MRALMARTIDLVIVMSNNGMHTKHSVVRFDLR